MNKRLATTITQLTLLILALSLGLSAQSEVIPKSHHNIFLDQDGNMFYVTAEGDTLPRVEEPAEYTLEMMRIMPEGDDVGLHFDFDNPNFSGKIYYGFYPDLNEVKHAYPVYYGRHAKIESGVAVIDFANRMVGKYDFIDWQATGRIHLGYRIANDEGQLLYDGKLRIRGTGPFEVDTSIIEGPFVNLVQPYSVVISFETNFPVKASVSIDGNSFMNDKPGVHHEITVFDLAPDTDYSYTVHCGPYDETHEFLTAPEPGLRRPFAFAYASDGRANAGGGERSIKGVNCYMLKKIAVMCALKNARFFHFTGDLISGYAIDPGEIELEYANWKRAAEPFAHSIPFIAGFGNHEALMNYFSNGEKGAAIDKFPFEALSAEAIFARNFVNPHNGPKSEDGSKYDPDPNSVDFPPYDETAFYYTYDNVAIISLNSNYWYAPSMPRVSLISGNLHGYIMDIQLKWMEETVAMLEADENIDHIFMTVHTPVFPNGGHVGDDMWYNGKNEYRAYVSGEPVDKGIIERRDEILDLLVNKSAKFKAALTGDEHNYSLLRINDEMPSYPDDYDKEKVKLRREVWQINNGAAGAPYYGQEDTPWMDHLQSFSTQNAVIFFHVYGLTIKVEVINPDTGELIDEFEL